MLRNATGYVAIMQRRQAVDHRLDRHVKENGLTSGAHRSHCAVHHRQLSQARRRGTGDGRSPGICFGTAAVSAWANQARYAITPGLLAFRGHKNIGNAVQYTVARDWRQAIRIDCAAARAIAE
jgi:hypothetical protein